MSKEHTARVKLTIEGSLVVSGTFPGATADEVKRALIQHAMRAAGFGLKQSGIEEWSINIGEFQYISDEEPSRGG